MSFKHDAIALIVLLLVVMLAIVGCNGRDVSPPPPKTPKYARDFMTLIVIQEDFEEAQTHICKKRRSDFRSFFDEIITFKTKYRITDDQFKNSLYCRAATRDDCPSYDRNCLKGKGFDCAYDDDEGDYEWHSQEITLVLKDNLICDWDVVQTEAHRLFVEPE